MSVFEKQVTCRGQTACLVRKDVELSITKKTSHINNGSPTTNIWHRRKIFWCHFLMQNSYWATVGQILWLFFQFFTSLHLWKRFRHMLPVVMGPVSPQDLENFSFFCHKMIHLPTGYGPVAHPRGLWARGLWARGLWARGLWARYRHVIRVAYICFYFCLLFCFRSEQLMLVPVLEYLFRLKFDPDAKQIICR